MRIPLIQFQDLKAVDEHFTPGSYGGFRIRPAEPQPAAFYDGLYWLVPYDALSRAVPKVKEEWVVTWEEQIINRRHRDDLVKRAARFDSEALAIHKARSLDLDGRKPKVERVRTVTFTDRTNVSYR